MMNKDDMREKYKIIRKNIINREDKDQIIFMKLLKNLHIKKVNTILIYVSTEYEVNTLKVISNFLNNKKIAVPKVENGIINFYYINSLDDLKLGYHNIYEPISLLKVESFCDSVCIVPGICFDKNNYRIGYGKGFYDKFLSKNKDLYTIGLCYKECLVKNIPINSYDCFVDKVITD